MSKYNKIVIGLDQSYKNTGISIAADGKLKKVSSIHLEKCHCNSDRRQKIILKLESCLSSMKTHSDEVECIIERIRLRSGGFLNIDYIKSIGALNATIVDVCKKYNVPVYSVDTRAWKAQIIGTSKPKSNNFGVPDEKWPTVEWCIRQGFEKSILIPIQTRKTKGTFIVNGQKYMYNNDASDSAGIAMYGFLGDRKLLQEER